LNPELPVISSAVAFLRNRSIVRGSILAVAGILLALALAGPADAAPSKHKAIWGPATPTAFNKYSKLGVGIYQKSISWASIAPTRPKDPRDPSDPAYNWLAELDTAIALAKSRGIRVGVNLTFAPRWASGHGQRRWAPKHPETFADFAAAAARRYPYVKYWMIWSEPSRRENFMPLARVRSSRQLTQSEKRGPRLYSGILDAAYRAIKSVAPHDLVVGGNTIPGGDIRPLRYIQAMRLSSGKPPRMDLYGHNAYSPRIPRLSQHPAAKGTADLSDFDSLTGWLDRYLGRNGRNKRLKIFVSEYSLPTNRNDVLPFWGNLRDQAKYATAALKLGRDFKRLYTLGWFQLYDEAPQPDNLQANWGLLDWKGNPKPAFRAFKNG
jgi:hypothetical protein